MNTKFEISNLKFKIVAAILAILLAVSATLAWAPDKKQPSPVVDGKSIVTHHTFYSKSMKREMGYNIYLPPNYDLGKEQRYHVVYWLHGLNGNEYKDIDKAIYPHRAIVKGDLPPLIIVYVNGIARSFYCDSANGKVMSETMIIKELIPHIDKEYRTVASRPGRSITGMSMGGFGCLHLAFKYPEMFCSVVSYAAALVEPATLDAAAGSPSILTNMFGGDVSRFKAEYPTTLVLKNKEKIRGQLAIRLVVGTKDYKMVPGVRKLHNTLLQMNIDHDYEELANLGHTLRRMYPRVGIQGLKFAIDASKATAARAAVDEPALRQPSK